MKKALTWILVLVTVLSLCACGSAKEEVSAPAAEKQKLVMGCNAAFPPYEYIGDDGESIVGFEVDILQYIADKLGRELEIVDMEFGSVLTSVQTGKIDIGVSGITVTEERKQNVNFTTSYTTAQQTIIVSDDSPITSVDDLFEDSSIIIGVQESTTGHIYCEDDFGADRVVAFSLGANAVEALIGGKVDCVIIDDEVAKAFVAANTGLHTLSTAYALEDYAFAVAKENTELLAQVNEVLEAMIADGTMATMKAKYISAD